MYKHQGFCSDPATRTATKEENVWLQSKRLLDPRSEVTTKRHRARKISATAKKCQFQRSNFCLSKLPYVHKLRLLLKEYSFRT